VPEGAPETFLADPVDNLQLMACPLTYDETLEKDVTMSFDSSEPSSCPTAAVSSSASEQLSDSERQHEPHGTADTAQVPGPKRMTLAAQKVQHRKLIRPFRSPVLHVPVRLTSKPGTKISMGNDSSTDLVAAQAPSSPVETTTVTAPKPTETKVKHRTPRAAAQFKSPLTFISTGNDRAELVRLTPTIQTLERKLQLLKRAVKVREESEEDILRGLVKKWTDAGREVAWEVWDLVKDNVSEESSMGDKGKKRPFGDSWGWDESGDAKKVKVEERNWGWDVVPAGSSGEDSHQPDEELDVNFYNQQQKEDSNDEGTVRPTLGKMLLQFSIAHETLGWSDDEENFVDY